MYDTFKEHLARQNAVGREKFGPGERRLGVPDHIRKELEEIEKEDTAEGRATEWTDVAILGLDGLLRAVREMIRQDFKDDHGVKTTGPIVEMDNGDRVIGYNGEPTNDYVAEVAVTLIRNKQSKNELRDFGNWRDKSEDVAIEHTRGIHD